MHRGFTFAAGTCDPGHTACLRTIPKGWTPAEIAIAQQGIDEVLATPDGATILSLAAGRGVSTLRRHGVFIGRAGPVSAAAALRRTPSAAAIELYDTFFSNPGRRDLFSGKPGFLVASAVLLHEYLHAIDDVSGDAEFLRLAGFERRGERWQFTVRSAEEASVLARFNEEFPRLERARDFMGQWRLGREAAMMMRPVRVPTIQATVRPAEAFAEIGAILVLDRNARQYLRRELVAYFDSKVFRRPPRG